MLMAERDQMAHPLWPWTKERWEDLNAGERRKIKERVQMMQEKAKADLDEAYQLKDYIMAKEQIESNKAVLRG